MRAIARTVLSSDEGVEIKDIRASTKPTQQQVWWWRTHAPKYTNVGGYFVGVSIYSRTAGRDALLKDCVPAREKQHYDKHKDGYQENRHKRIAYQVQYKRNRLQTDDAFRLLKNCRNRLEKALKGKSKAAKTLELIGCTPDELLEHLERTMSPEVRTHPCFYF